MTTIAIAPTVAALREKVKEWRRRGETVALVPTMGALHRGHISLVEHARGQASRTVVSIFVNPTQFAPNEDFAKYPRTFEDDCRQLDEARADLVFAPGVEEMYPKGFATEVGLSGPAAVGLEDKFRPTHFAGVATVVLKLFNQCAPDCAIFGEKDYQQLKVITHMARDLDLPIRVVGAETVREPDGLALSSRNRYLSPADRKAAASLPRIMRETVAAIQAGNEPDAVLAQAREKLAARGFAVDYLEWRDAQTLQPPEKGSRRPSRLLVAARIGATRLIDNMAV